jgi:hypothetical protein
MLSLNFFVCTQVYSCDRFETMNAFIWNILKKFPFYEKQRTLLRVVLLQDWWPNHPFLTVLQNRKRNFIYFFIPEDTMLIILVMPKFLFLLRNSDSNCPDDSNYKFLYSRMTEVPNVTFENKIYFFISDDWRRLSVSEQHSLRHWSGKLVFQFQFIKENIFFQYLYIF